MSFRCSGAARAFVRPAGVALLVLAATGCGGRGDVSGKVTYKGKPLVWGTVLFEGSDRTFKQGNIGSDGTYTIRGLATGEAWVAVSSINPTSPDFQTRLPSRAPRPNRSAGVNGWFPIPQKYDTPFTSGLTYPIKRGPNEIDIELK